MSCRPYSPTKSLICVQETSSGCSQPDGSSTALWFHPLVWKLRDAHNAACEEVCDAVAADYVGNAESYSSTLARVALETMRKIPAIGGIPMARSSQIIDRLRTLKRKIYSLPLARHWVILSLLTGLVSLLVFGGLKLAYAEKSETKADVPANLKEGLVLYYSFDNDDGRTVTDLSGRGNHGRVSSGAYVSNGKIGRAMSFNGDGDYIDVGPISSLAPEQTKSLWINMHSFPQPSYAAYLIDEGKFNENNNWVELVDSDGNGIPEVRAGYDAGNWLNSDGKIRKGSWHHIVVVSGSSGELAIYINGALDSSKSGFRATTQQRGLVVCHI